MGTQTPEDRLLTLLRQQGILYASPTQPVLSRDGTPARWMLDSLCVSLEPEGIALAGQCLLTCLARFQGRQIATYGVTAIPLLTSCILQSEGRYHGLLVRPERKPHGSRKLIEGRIDPEEPTIILDDSVSSGTNMLACCAHLEEAGLRVEGGVCLVRFGWSGGFARMQARGYHMETVYDIWDDFISHMEGEPEPVPNPTKVFPRWTWQATPAPEDCHPAHLARMMMEAYLRCGQLLRPPTSFDTAYDGAGGVWVSVRDRAAIHRRYGRDGFWHFPGEARGPLGHDVAMAALKTAAQLPQGAEGLRLLEQSAIAVTFFTQLEACTVGALDNDRYGIVVCSRERLGRMGGALPCMPGISSAWQQFQHARMTNAGLLACEPYQLYRHDVVKVVEPGVTWQPTGVPKSRAMPWDEMADVAGRVVTRARALVLETLGLGEPSGHPLPDDLLHDALDSLYVTVYMHGHLRGCMGSVVQHLETDLAHLVRCALADPRFPDRDVTPDTLAVTVSLLSNPLTLGTFSPEEVVQRVRHGHQALMVSQGTRVGLLLPFVAATENLRPQEYALAVIDKAGIPGPPYTWRRFDCRTWLADHTGPPRLLRGALPVASVPPVPDVGLAQLATLFSHYLLRHQREDGSLFLRYLPHQDILYEGDDLPRTAHGAWVLCRAGHQLGDPALEAGGRTLTALLVSRLTQDVTGHYWLQPEREPASVAEVSFLLLALCSTPGRDATPALAGPLAATLWARFNAHGRIATHAAPQAQDDVFQDFFPGQVLLALAHACRVGVSHVDHAHLSRAFALYRHRFRYKRRFAHVPWHMQAFTAWWHVLREPDFASYVFEIADWLLGYQQVADGGFINDAQWDTPGYTTVLYLEGLGAATRLAEAVGDPARATRYHAACERGWQFVQRLVIQPPMTTLLPNPAWALGGVRASLMQDYVRIDFVQHALSAVLELYPPVQSEGGT